jgi:hypothetical protein
VYTRRGFILAGASLASAAFLAPQLSFARQHNTLRAGAGRARIELASLLPFGGFVSQHDSLFTRVVIMAEGEQRQAIAVVDLTSLTVEVIGKMKAIIREIAGISEENTLINASHSFSTPHISLSADHPQEASEKTDAVLHAFELSLRAATRQAVADLKPARLGAGSGHCRLGVNRNVATPWGWWLGADDAGYADPHVGVLRIDDMTGKPIAVLINYAVQPAVLDGSQNASGGRAISADLAGATIRYVEEQYGDDTVAFYLVGCVGDQVPYLQASRHVVEVDGHVSRVDIHEQAFPLLTLFGQRLGSEVVRVANAIVTSRADLSPIERNSITLKKLTFSPRNAPTGPVKSFDYQENGSGNLPVILMKWGDVALVGLQPEFSASTGVFIRNASPFANTFVMTMADGANKYLPDQSNYDRFTYEARSSSFAPGSAETAASAIVAQLKKSNTTSTL